VVAAEQAYQWFCDLSIDDIIGEVEAALPFRSVPDAPPLRMDLSPAELTVLAALADAHREEALQACIDRRPARRGAVTREYAERHIATGMARADHRWMVSILARFAPGPLSPDPSFLDTGARSLITRNLARAGNGAMELSPELQVFCDGLANISSFAALAVHPPWAEPAVKLFSRGTQYFWGIEFSEDTVGRARVSRLGSRAMEALLRQHLTPLGAHAPPMPVQMQLPQVPPPVPVHAPQAPPPAREQPPPPAPKSVPAAAPPQPAVKQCGKCDRVLRPGQSFCPSCGISV
jgi:hypothetical protein